MHSVQGEEKEEGSSARETLPIMHESIRKHRRRGAAEEEGTKEGRRISHSLPQWPQYARLPGCPQECISLVIENFITVDLNH